jgi:crotonobetainyl-CoA:carnitine CoA-transferase CaiB-like acyl-CoA transferase
MEKENERLPLEGVRVLELGHTVMGPTCGLILADMGAEVIKVEKAPDGDDTRRLTGFGSGFFPYLNRNKSSIALNLKSEQGKAVLRRLVEKVDVLVENFAPGAMDRLGFGWEDCRRINPRLIYCALKGFLPGPYEKRPALDEVVQMMSGLAYMTGPSGRPLRAGASVVDIMGGTFGAVGILAALYNRNTTGRGEFVHSALFEAAAFLVGQHMAVKAVSGEAPPPMPERGRSWSIYDLFPTADGEQVFVGVTSDAHWQSMCRTFGFEDLAGDERLATNNQRVAERDWFLPEIIKRISRLSKAEIMELAEKAKIPFAPVAKPEDLFEDRHLNMGGALAETTLPDGRKAALPKLPLRLGPNPFNLRSDPPPIGRGAAELLKSIGYTQEEITDLCSQGYLRVEE